MFPRHPTLAALVCLTLLSGAFLAGCSSRDETPKHTPEQEQQSALPESASTQDRSAGNEARIDSAASNPTTTPAESRPRVEPAVPIPPPGPTRRVSLQSARQQSPSTGKPIHTSIPTRFIWCGKLPCLPFP
jgi:cytoskeletal protein RodZ